MGRLSTPGGARPPYLAYILAVGLLALFLAWAAIAANPFGAKKAADPRLAALARRERALQVRAAHVRRVVDHRWAAYRVALRGRRRQIAADQRRFAALIEARQQEIADARAAAAAAARAAAAAAAAAPSSSSPSVPVVSSPPVVATSSS